MNLSRRSFVRGLSVVSASALLPFPLRALAQEGPVVQTPRGAVRGAVQDGVHVFRGVPCGKNPYEGALRLAAQRWGMEKYFPEIQKQKQKQKNKKIK